MLTESRKNIEKSRKWIYLLSLLYLTACIWFLNNDHFWFAAVPLGLAFAILALVKASHAFLLIVFLTPVSVRVLFEEMGASIQLPYEPIVILLTGFFLLKVLLDWKYDNRVLKHAIAIALILNLAWMLITSISSTMPMVSFKHFLSRFWFITVFYFFAIILFRDFTKMKQFFWLYSASLCGIIIYTIYRHSEKYFSHDYSNYAMHPFYTDHGIYAAVIAMLMPVMFAFVLKSKTLGITRAQQFFAIIVSAIFITGMYFSYTRAAWVSLAVGAGAFILFMFRLRLVTILSFIMIVGGLLFLFRTDIMIAIQQNKEVSNDDVSQHVRSITNVSTDDSNVERLNRWMSAWRMFREKPVTGWGPNTYMFQYAPFQSAFERTSISTNRGNQGNAHSEFIGPLAEQGLPGMLIKIAIVLIAISKGMKLFYHHHEERVRIIALAVTLGLITYFSHGLLNNYLDNGKAAMLIWGFLAVLTSLDIYFREKETVAK